MTRDLSALQHPTRGAGLAAALPPAPRVASPRFDVDQADAAIAVSRPGIQEEELLSSPDLRNRPVVLYLPILLAQHLVTTKESTGHSYAELILAAFDAHHDAVEGQSVPARRSALPPARPRRRRTPDGIRSIQLRLSALELRVIDQVAEQKHLSRSALLSAVVQRYLEKDAI